MRRVLLVIITILATTTLYAQSVVVNCRSESLDKILDKMTMRYGVELSYDSEELSLYTATLNTSFSSFGAMLDTLLDELPFAWELIDGVYVVYPRMIEPPKPILGIIRDIKSGEPLPFAYIEVNGAQRITDENGNFSVRDTGEDTLRVKASYLGYFKLDTLIARSEPLLIELSAAPVTIGEVTIQSYFIERATQVGEKAGLITVNQQIASYLPGNGDDAIFNLLRVQPGVLAAGEQSSELILWGSPEGTSRTYIDGIPLWGLSNFSDNISTINPYMVSRIDLYRGGYGADSPDAAGGIALIRGKVGGKKPQLGFFLNNETVNSSLELPIGEKSTIIAAYRQNYYDLFDSDNLTQINKLEEKTEVKAIPSYSFRDLNIKYNFRGDNGDLFYISSIYGIDNLGYDLSFDSEMETPTGKPSIRYVKQSAEEQKEQLGVSAYYGKMWRNGASSSLSAVYSQLHNDYYLTRESYGEITQTSNYSRWDARNNISEAVIKQHNELTLTDTHKLSFGVEYTDNSLLLREDSLDINHINIEERTSRFTIYGEDKISFSNKFSLTAGIRATYYMANCKLYIDPRLSINYRLSEILKFNAALGIYHQYVVETSVSNDDGNYVYSWNLAGVNDIPVVRAEHLVAGVAYTPKGYIFTIDGYYKSFNNLTRYVAGEKFSTNYQGENRTYGVDLYAKRDFRSGSSVWFSYSLSHNDEYFEHFRTVDYQRSTQDQRHEIKVAGIWRVGAFHLSATYIYGSGFPIYSGGILSQTYTEPDYNRLDVSAVYTFYTRWCKGNIGLSILNLTDADNIKTNSFSRIPLTQQNGISIDSGSTPFTPLLYLKLAF